MEGFRSIADATSAKTRCHARMEGPWSSSDNRLPRALIVPTGISNKGSISITDASSATSKPLWYTQFITYFQCFPQHRKGIWEIETLRKQDNEADETSAIIKIHVLSRTLAGTPKLLHCDSHGSEMSCDYHSIGDVIIDKRSNIRQVSVFISFHQE